MNFYNINEFSERIGVCVNTLRNWDKAGLLSPSHKTAGGHRRYTEEQAVSYLNNPDESVHVGISSDKVSSVTGTYPLSDTQVDAITDFFNNNIL